MSEYIAIFQIGPVQEYINNSKRTQDFWSGSYILSYLSAVAIETLQAEIPESIVYPFSDDPLLSVVKGKTCHPKEHDFSKISGEHIGTLPNRFVAIHDDFDRLSSVLQLSTRCVSDAYAEIVRQVDECLKKALLAARYKIDEKQWTTLWERQNKAFITAMWVISERKNDSYGDDYREAERLFGARKGIRNFDQTPGEPQKKCTLCGERESLPPPVWNSIHQDKQESTHNSLNKIRYSFRVNERLCTSCIVKRLAPQIFFDKKSDPDSFLSFPSTSTIAVSPALCRLTEKWDGVEIQKNVEDFIQSIVHTLKLDFPRKLRPLPFVQEKINQNIKYTNQKHIFGWDGDLFIKDTYQKQTLQKEYNLSSDIAPKVINSCRENLKDFLGPFRPSKYYAVIMMDGDNMGKHLSDCQDKDEHKAFSQRLGSFARFVVPRIAESFFTAKVAYFGGDEGVIFVGIDDLFRLMRHLRAAFSGHIRIDNDGCHVDFTGEGADEIQAIPNERFYATAGKGKTACIAGVVAHHQQSLLHVMEILRNSLEHKAKEVKGKDAFCITLMKRSGGTTYATGKWTYNQLDMMDHLEKMVNLYRKNFLTWSWLYDLDREKIGIGTGEWISAEMKRLIQRHSLLDKNDFQQIIEPMYQELRFIYDNMLNEMGEKALENFIQLELSAHYIEKGGGN